MLEQVPGLESDIRNMLDAIAEIAHARYACLAEPQGVRFAHGAEGGAEERFLADRLPRLFALPATLEGSGPEQDVFEGWEGDEFLLVFLNGRIALVLFCPDAEAARRDVERPFEVLADRLLRWRPALRVDAQGRGLFFGRPRVDWIVIAGAPGDAA